MFIVIVIIVEFLINVSFYSMSDYSVFNIYFRLKCFLLIYRLKLPKIANILELNCICLAGLGRD